MEAHERGAIGRRVWAIAEGYLPEGSEVHDPARVSHEALCLLNTGDVPATVEVWAYFADREPAGPYRLIVPARRTLHARFDDLRDPEPIPRGTDYASLIVSSVPIVAQHTRLDARPGVHALLSTVPFGA